MIGQTITCFKGYSVVYSVRWRFSNYCVIIIKKNYNKNINTYLIKFTVIIIRTSNDYLLQNVSELYVLFNISMWTYFSTVFLCCDNAKNKPFFKIWDFIYSFVLPICQSYFLYLLCRKTQKCFGNWSFFNC